MFRQRVAEIVLVSALAATATAIVASPVLRAPSERVFGAEIVGRHHDPFSVMEQFSQPIRVAEHWQPITDVAGALLARISGGVAAYNWLVLLSFPLSAAMAYLLARYLGLSATGALVAAMFFAFSPFHIAQAAYHPHIAQTQWIPLYLLALWRCLDDPSPPAVVLLGAATIVVTLSNFYGGLIAAVMTPIAVAAYWLRTGPVRPQPARRLGITVGSLVLLAFCGVTYVSYFAPAVFTNAEAFAFPRINLALYSAKWWSYLIPPVQHPWLGAAARRVWTAAGVRDGLLEQQVSLGWGVIALALVAAIRWLRRDRQPASIAWVPVLVSVAGAALVCSLSPDWAIGRFTLARPSALLYTVVPMFRAYARFGVIVQLMTVLLAGIGVDYLLRTGSRRAQVACVALLALAVCEYAVAPATLWRDVLPTSAHRWVMRQPGRVRALDCTQPTRTSHSVEWLTDHRVTSLTNATSDCTEPNFPSKLTALGYTHLLVRRDSAEGRWFATHPLMGGLQAAANFEAAQVFAVTARTPAIYTATMTGFFRREHKANRTWRWMGDTATWTIANTTEQPIDTALDVELWAFHHRRQVDVALDGRHVQTVFVDPKARVFRIEPLSLSPGGHEMAFLASEAPTVVAHVTNRAGRRAVSVAMGRWSWSHRGESR